MAAESARQERRLSKTGIANDCLVEGTRLSQWGEVRCAVAVNYQQLTGRLALAEMEHQKKRNLDCLPRGVKVCECRDTTVGRVSALNGSLLSVP